MKLYLIISYIVAATLLLLGGLLYIVYRPLTLKMFQWFHMTECTPWLLKFRSLAPLGLPDWIIYALPDGLWACSYAILIGSIWHFSVPNCIPVALIIPLAGIVSEFSQAVKLLPGVFDMADVVAYGLGTIAGVTYIYIMNRIKQSNTK